VLTEYRLTEDRQWTEERGKRTEDRGQRQTWRIE